MAIDAISTRARVKRARFAFTDYSFRAASLVHWLTGSRAVSHLSEERPLALRPTPHDGFALDGFPAEELGAPQEVHATRAWVSPEMGFQYFR